MQKPHEEDVRFCQSWSQFGPSSMFEFGGRRRPV